MDATEEAAVNHVISEWHHKGKGTLNFLETIINHELKQGTVCKILRLFLTLF